MAVSFEKKPMNSLSKLRSSPSSDRRSLSSAPIRPPSYTNTTVRDEDKIKKKTYGRNVRSGSGSLIPTSGQKANPHVHINTPNPRPVDDNDDGYLQNENNPSTLNSTYALSLEAAMRVEKNQEFSHLDKDLHAFSSDEDLYDRLRPTPASIGTNVHNAITKTNHTTQAGSNGKFCADSESSDSDSEPVAPVARTAAASLEDVFDQEVAKTEKKYTLKKIPIPLSEKALLKRLAPHLSLVPQILAGSQTSYFYSLARDIQDRSSNEEITLKEFSSLQISKLFSCGYIGPKRQTIAFLAIQKRYSAELLAAYSKNSTLRFWSIDSFASYVLANELLCRLVIEDYKCSEDQAYAVMESTADYGKYIADRVPTVFEEAESVPLSPEKADLKTIVQSDSILGALMGGIDDSESSDLDLEVSPVKRVKAEQGSRSGLKRFQSMENPVYISRKHELAPSPAKQALKSGFDPATKCYDKTSPVAKAEPPCDHLSEAEPQTSKKAGPNTTRADPILGMIGIGDDSSDDNLSE
ncbi:hypothetical protein BABINDRAFT_161308 [Babjeviella inositovora NRRL Y-12698]|uniref:Restriction of telomere capping protein 4 n=1 Tax=Babjeviella inositovora NRRL Y-12698 TaxID=984486 RepID=A0A1E3QRU7_9ASCO|nr:uncharacterized protein BABINDRAFT_161308 [Babjeviella inositovora NRRL Y-12698]ODQ80358.1 hypothetical protein BABINDRAFT_161308 [Babjeviella inositovora NRRL Y-12698]